MKKRFDDLLAAAARLDLDAIAADVAGFSAPQQERARQKTRCILAATACLLQERAFDTISVWDIAQTAGCSPTTIYSRFIDKDALAPLVYMLVVEYYRASEPSAFLLNSQSIDELCLDVIGHYEKWFKENTNLSSLIMSNYSISMHTLVMRVISAFAERINPTVARLLGVAPDLTLGRIEFALRVNTALYRDLNMVRAGTGAEATFDPDRVAQTMALILKSSAPS